MGVYRQRINLLSRSKLLCRSHYDEAPFMVEGGGVYALIQRGDCVHTDVGQRGRARF